MALMPSLLDIPPAANSTSELPEPTVCYSYESQLGLFNVQVEPRLQAGKNPSPSIRFLHFDKAFPRMTAIVDE